MSDNKMSDLLLNSLTAMENNATHHAPPHHSEAGEFGGAEDEFTESYEHLPVPDLAGEGAIKQQESKVGPLIDSDVVEDFQRARNINHALQDHQLFLLTNATRLAVSTESPQAYKAANDIANTLRGINDDMLKQNKALADIMTKNKPKAVGAGETSVEVDGETGNVTVTKGKSVNTKSLLNSLEKIREAKANGTLDSLTVEDLNEDSDFIDMETESDG